MILRKLRWLGAFFLALGAALAAPSRSHADITVQVEEVNSSGGVVQTVGTFNSAVGSNTINFSTSSTSFIISSFSSTLSATTGNFGSLTSSFTLQIGSGFTLNPGDGLNFQVLATGASNNFVNQPGQITNNAGASSGIAGTGGLNNIAGINQVISTTTAGGVTTGSSISQIGDGSVTLPQTGTTTAFISSLPNPYQITQTITVYALPVNTSAQIAVGATYGGSASSTVISNAPPPASVPAPGGLALGLIALPFFGLRRAFRRPIEQPAV